MSRLIDVSNNRLRPADELEPDMPADVYAAFLELYAGENHLMLPLGGEAAEDSARRLVESGRALQVSGGFLTFLIGQKGMRMQRVVYGPDGVDPTPMAMRFATEISELAPNDVPTDRILATSIRSHGGSALVAAVCVEDPDSVEAFDGLYVPKPWLNEVPHPPEMTAEEYAISLAAGYMVLAMTDPGFSKN